MKLTKMSDGRFVLELGGVTLVLSGLQVAQLADLINGADLAP